MSLFSVEIFCLTVPKHFVGEPFCVSQNSSIEKIYGKEGGRGGGRRECHNFPSKIFCLTVPKKFVGEPFTVSFISGIEKFYA